MTDICLCLPPGCTWHKVNKLIVDYSGCLVGGGEVGHELRLETFWTLLVIGPLSACMPDCSLNGIAKPIAIQEWQNFSMMQLAHAKVTLTKLGAFQPQVCHWTLAVRLGCEAVRWKASSPSTAAGRYIFSASHQIEVFFARPTLRASVAQGLF